MTDIFKNIVSCRHNVTTSISNGHRFGDKNYIKKHGCDDFSRDYVTATCARRDKLF